MVTSLQYNAVPCSCLAGSFTLGDRTQYVGTMVQRILRRDNLHSVAFLGQPAV